MKEEEEPPR